MQDTELGGFSALPPRSVEPKPSPAASEPFALAPAQLGVWYAQLLDPDVPVNVAQYVDVHGELDAAAYLHRAIDEYPVTTARLVTSMLEAFHPGSPVAYRTSLRSVFAWGETRPAAPSQRLRVLTGARLHKLYGPTEAAVDVTFHEVADTDTLSMPIGAPVFDTRLYVLDSRLRPVPVGVPGELYLSGVQLARGCTPPYVLLDTLPVDASGALDRGVLPAFSRASADYTAPATAVEQAVARVPSEVLGNKLVGRNDDFFALGGNSLVATQVAARLSADLNCPLRVRGVFAACTVAELAALVERAGGSSGASLVAQLRARPRPPLVPLSPARQRIWFLNRFERVGHAELPFVQVVAALDPPRSQARHPLFHVLHAFDNAEAIAVELPELSVATSTLDTGVTKLDLRLTVTENSAGAGLGEGSAPAGVPAEFTYATDLFDSATVAGYARMLIGFLWAVPADPEIAVLHLRLLDCEDQARVIAAGPAPVGAHDSARTLLTAFEARRTPDAVLDAGRRLTHPEFPGVVAASLRTLPTTAEALLTDPGSAVDPEGNR
ncbi:AMP-binding protein [Nocardia abscessus]|uniref:AMP-binding protein n=1 Tax=Nocardia abscessus TaxID=120957 RepID=UPI0002D6E057|nr:AMP-binding protein [Nocardia abscessus]MCC3328735.1 AMP-binding protein [Nocardia abscessus]